MKLLFGKVERSSGSQLSNGNGKQFDHYDNNDLTPQQTQAVVMRRVSHSGDQCASPLHFVSLSMASYNLYITVPMKRVDSLLDDNLVIYGPFSSPLYFSIFVTPL